ncbi:19360_t:CDS:1 [Gigaspora margarita]|uniref:19360_t:CDS:1 n=1 Tax=Gigaspora margarita TaxID=4874 RepID=A0ABN7WJE0_GIGMA|nr:19360_t:CDS:1 [Gigaspora margarita]
MTSEQNDQLQPTVNETVFEIELEDNYDYDEPKPWFPTGELKNLPTEIYSDCTLPRTERQKILRGEPRNAEIEYQPPQMEQYFLRAMSKQQREFDKIIRSISYRTSAILRPIDNIEKILHDSKPDDNDPEAKAGYELLRRSNHNARELLRDALSQMIIEGKLHLRQYHLPTLPQETKKESLGTNLKIWWKKKIPNQNSTMMPIGSDEDSRHLYKHTKGSVTPETPFQETALRKEDIKLITGHLEPDLNLRKEIFNKATTTNHGLDQRSDTWTTKAIQTKVVRNIWRFLAHINYIKWLHSRMVFETPIRSSQYNTF